MSTSANFDSLSISYKLSDGDTPGRDRWTVIPECVAEGVLYVRLAKRSPQEAALAKRARKAAKRGASNYARGLS